MDDHPTQQQLPSRRSPLYTGAVLGGLLWIVLLVTRFPITRDPLGLIAPLLLLAILVFTPLALELVAPPEHKDGYPWPYAFARVLHPLASASAILSFFVKEGTAAGLFASVWLLFTLLLALFGLGRLRQRGFSRLDWISLDIALLYLPVGAAWLVASRMGMTVFGFGGVISLLTAVHFHYAGFIAPILSGMTGGELARQGYPLWKLYRIAAIGVIAGPPLVAVGIAVSSEVEVVAAIVLTISITLLAVIVLARVAPGISSTPARLLLRISSLASVVAMTAALLYAITTFIDMQMVSIPRMVMVHGILNATFALCGLAGWSIVVARERRREAVGLRAILDPELRDAALHTGSSVQADVDENSIVSSPTDEHGDNADPTAPLPSEEETERP